MTVFVLEGRITRADVPVLRDRFRALLEQSGAASITCQVGGLTDPDAVVVDALARLQLTAQRFGSTIRVRGACPHLQELIALAGLRDVLTLAGESALESALESVGQPEEREQLRVEEEVQGTEPAS